LDLFETSEADAAPGDGLHWPDVRGWLQAHPQMLLDDRSLLEEIGLRDTVSHPDAPDLKVLASPLKFDGQRPPNRAAPLLGADSEDILADLGYDADEIASLRAGGIV
jgi:crotonobetainyl-CoA:carnitine CoA-transferase CaiB-like acyl-CoA transferase